MRFFLSFDHCGLLFNLWRILAVGDHGLGLRIEERQRCDTFKVVSLGALVTTASVCCLSEALFQRAFVALSEVSISAPLFDFPGGICRYLMKSKSRKGLVLFDGLRIL